MVKDSTLVAIGAMACITVLEAVALLQGIDGAILSAITALLAGLGGFTAGKTTSR